MRKPVTVFKRSGFSVQALSLLGVTFCLAGPVQADGVVDWNETATDITVSVIKSPAMGNHVLAMVQTAVYEATNAVTHQYPISRFGVQPVSDASVEAAIAAANHAMLLRLIPKQKAKIDAAYAVALERIPAGAAKDAGIATGKRAEKAVSRWRQALPYQKAAPYRPITSPGVYIPTAGVAGPGWGSRPTWVLPSASALRPPPPPSLTSETWAKDYQEVLLVGAKESAKRTDDQTEMALFWSATVPSIYYPIVRSVARMEGRELTRNARLFAAAGQAMDDALVSVFEAKYFHRFWRPITAIRNGDIDGNEGTERVASWTPLIKTPMHPEYPCAHCIVAGAIAGVLNADLGDTPSPRLETVSPNLPGVTRQWHSPDEFAQEVSDARIFDGVHYRTSAIVGNQMGKQIGMMAAEKAVSP
ncbi:MAG: vanadium-dependent haloperoxidase [Burkholderiaceae bacterium]